MRLTHGKGAIETSHFDQSIKEKGTVANKTRIGFFAALPWEYGTFKRGLGPWRKFSTKPFKAFTLSMGDKDLLLVETGMGKTVVETALNWAFRSWHPHVLVSFGFAGGLSRSVRVGDVFLCTEFHYFDSGARAMAETAHRVEPHPEVLAFCRSHGSAAARCVTTLHLEAKGFPWAGPHDSSRPQGAIHRDRFLPTHQGDVPTLVDMESCFAARFAGEHRLPLLCFRAVSDAHDQDLGFQLADISDSRGRVDLWRVSTAIVRDPAVIKAFMASWRRSHRAARNLGKLLTAFTRLPASRIRPIPGPGMSWPEMKPDP